MKNISLATFSNINIKVDVTKLTKTAIIPTYGSDKAGGADLYADIPGRTVVPPGGTVRIGTGIAMAIPDSFSGLIFARSGLSTKNDLAPANKVGLIDSDYRGEIVVYLHNHGSDPQIIEPCQRIAQIVFVNTPQASFNEVESLDDTERGNNGFGSTGR